MRWAGPTGSCTVRPDLAGGWLLHYGRTGPDGPTRRRNGRSRRRWSVCSSPRGASNRGARPLHQGDVIPDRVPRTLSDGFSFVAEYARLGPWPGRGTGTTSQLPSCVRRWSRRRSRWCPVVRAPAGAAARLHVDRGAVGRRRVVRARGRGRTDHRFGVAGARARLDRARARRAGLFSDSASPVAPEPGRGSRRAPSACARSSRGALT